MSPLQPFQFVQEFSVKLVIHLHADDPLDKGGSLGHRGGPGGVVMMYGISMEIAPLQVVSSLTTR